MRDLGHPALHLEPGDLGQKKMVLSLKTLKTAQKRAKNSLFFMPAGASLSLLICSFRVT
jgi:hypothetical protein